jgi:hypothetical protein
LNQRAHTGECELIGDKIGGIAVHIGARVSAPAALGEVLVSPGAWQLFSVERDADGQK